MTSGKRRLQRGTALVFAICASAVIIGAVASKANEFRLLFGILAGLAIGVTFHELGHLTCAAIGSIPVYRIVIGAGPLLWRSRFGDTCLEVRALPLSGRVEPYPVMNCRWYWWALFLLGGVLGNLAVICLLFGSSTIGASAKAGDILGSIKFMQVFMVITNIVPLSGRFANDGMRLLRLLSGRAPHRALFAQLSELYNASLSGYGKANTQFTMTATSSRLLYHLIRFQTDKDAHPDARAGVLRELHRGDLGREENIWALDALVTDGIISSDPAVRPHLDGWSRQALALGPDLPTLQGSRGAVLVELGRYEEGKALLAPLAQLYQLATKSE